MSRMKDLAIDRMNAEADREAPRRCPDPEHCTEPHNEAGPDGEGHHQDCGCRWCQQVAWSMKH